MATDPRKLKPSELCRLVNSTPLGEVLTESLFRKHRAKAGYRFTTGSTVDLLKYVGWLVGKRHGNSKSNSSPVDTDAAERREEWARSAAAVAGGSSSKWERVLAGLLTESSYAKAALKAGIGETTLYRLLKDPAFRKAYDKARKELVAASVAKLQSATGDAVEALMNVARKAKRDGDRVRAATALLDHAWKGMLQTDLLQDPSRADDTPASTAEVVKVLSRRLRALESTAIPAADNARLTVSIADALLRAIGVDELEKRMAALEGVFKNRKEM